MGKQVEIDFEERYKCKRFRRVGNQIIDYLTYSWVKHPAKSDLELEQTINHLNRTEKSFITVPE